MSDQKDSTNPEPPRRFPRRPYPMADAPSHPSPANNPPPVSPWSAPESLQDPLRAARRAAAKKAEQFPSKEEMQKFFRRVNRPDLEAGPLPHRWQRGASILATTLSLGVGVFMVFYMNFGYEDHCFTPLRRWAGTQDKQVEVWKAATQDNWIKKTGFTREELAQMVGEEELDTAAPDRSRRERINIHTLSAAKAKEAADPASHYGNYTSASDRKESIKDQVKGTIWTRERL